MSIGQKKYIWVYFRDQSSNLLSVPSLRFVAVRHAILLAEVKEAKVAA